MPSEQRDSPTTVDATIHMFSVQCDSPTTLGGTVQLILNLNLHPKKLSNFLYTSEILQNSNSGFSNVTALNFPLSLTQVFKEHKFYFSCFMFPHYLGILCSVSCVT